ncbi:MAG: hypothetical protein AVDCRST_MAG66-1573, partial [uncultured Pseudonocardia sp.]
VSHRGPHRRRTRRRHAQPQQGRPRNPVPSRVLSYHASQPHPRRRAPDGADRRRPAPAPGQV